LETVPGTTTASFKQSKRISKGPSVQQKSVENTSRGKENQKNAKNINFPL